MGKSIEYEVQGTDSMNGQHEMGIPDYVYETEKIAPGAFAHYVNSALNYFWSKLRNNYPDATVSGFLPEDPDYVQPAPPEGYAFEELRKRGFVTRDSEEAFTYLGMLRNTTSRK